jgi:hypothetical protein
MMARAFNGHHYNYIALGHRGAHCRAGGRCCMHVFQAFSTLSHRDPFSSMQARTNSMKQLQSEAPSLARTKSLP